MTRRALVTLAVAVASIASVPIATAAAPNPTKVVTGWIDALAMDGPNVAYSAENASDCRNVVVWNVLTGTGTLVIEDPSHQKSAIALRRGTPTKVKLGDPTVPLSEVSGMKRGNTAGTCTTAKSFSGLLGLCSKTAKFKDLLRRCGKG